MKKGLLAIGLLVLSHALFAEGKVLNILVWNDEFSSRFDVYARKKIEATGVRVNFIQVPSQDGYYARKLDYYMENQSDFYDDEKIDLFLIEPGYYKSDKFLNSKYTLDMIRDIGLTKQDISYQYEYTKNVGKDNNGRIRAVSWQVCPGGFCYRRSIAKAVLGTDDPAEVQKALSDWDSFDNVAAAAKKKGYYMVSGYDDTIRPMLAGKKHELVNIATGDVFMDEATERWIDQTKLYTENGYNNNANLWSAEWFNGAKKDGKVFGCFGPAWFIDYCMAPNSLEDYKEYYIGNGSCGDWAFCMGPQGFYWGGSWICAAAGTDNVGTIRDLLKLMTCDEDVMYRMASECGDIVNNYAVMDRLAESSDKNNLFLGNQNPIYWYSKIAKSISAKGAYEDIYMDNLYEFFDYFKGNKLKSEARKEFLNVMRNRLYY